MADFQTSSRIVHLESGKRLLLRTLGQFYFNISFVCVTYCDKVEPFSDWFHMRMRFQKKKNTLHLVNYGNQMLTLVSTIQFFL